MDFMKITLFMGFQHVYRVPIFVEKLRMKKMATQILIAPGYGNSGEEHWQTYWQKENKDFVRIEQRDWFEPSADEWAETIEKYVREASGEVVVVAHSLACLALAYCCLLYT